MKDIDDIWKEMLPKLEIEVSSLSFDVFLKQLQPVKADDDALVLAAPTEGAKMDVISRYMPLLKSVIRDIEDAPSTVTVISKSEFEEARGKEHPAVKPSEDMQEPEPDRCILDPKYNFADFVVGKCNRVAYEAALAIAENPGEVFNPLFIYGDVGLGKTHIMQAIGNDLRLTKPHFKMLYVSSNTFINEFVASLRTSGGVNNRAFRDKYRNVDLLMMDDVQFLHKGQATQEELFNIFEHLKAAGKQMVFASDRTPQEIPDLDGRVRSRFASSMVVDVQPPDLETRIAILQKKSQKAKKNIDMAELSYIAEHVTSNVREMEGVLTKVIFLSKLYERKVDLDICKEALKDYRVQECDDITVDEIIDCTCKYYGVHKADVVGKRKNKEVVVPRQVAIYLINEFMNIPLTAIGEYFGGREHTTVMHARDKVASLVATDNKVKTEVNDIRAMILRK
ncbi:MAG: chromosomal replication initiator protein DnaA [Clostridiales bacterium]|nr:chromosomal replication initiator protein DnaA [Clostridiales bacterium]